MKNKDYVLLERAYSQVLLKENPENFVPYNDKDKMIEKITSLLPTLDVEDVQHIYDILVDEEEEEGRDEYGFTNKVSREDQLKNNLADKGFDVKF